MRNQHVWREVTEAGEKREVRAVKFAARWKLQSRLERGRGQDAANDWTYHDPPEVADLQALRELIWRKYQRKRASYDDVVSLDKLIAQRRQQLAPATGAQPEDSSKE